MILLYTATLLLFGIEVAHSVLGERYVLRRIERLETIPPLTLGDRELKVLRFA